MEVTKDGAGVVDEGRGELGERRGRENNHVAALFLDVARFEAFPWGL